MASFWSFSAMFMALMACNCSLVLASRQNMYVSTISAAPTALPGAPMYFSPTMSPDIEPLFPTPGGAAFSPSESTTPTIPSSPSPPNPDVSNSPGSVLAFPPSLSMPAVAPTSQGASLPLCSILHLAILVICIMQLHGV
ncbi:classical arabinogalactan protein 26 [Cajanus cajan]|uniref:Classical arabinogalactan protein 26 n=1 Tax=Cajanus cajan TaxID=3821 RepID=A0A151TX22_CAJCA|nr:classical arabinogalactan protein 26 [Cajanus cajan]KYP71504.1 Classical arabinogalactan protein 26 [Cajanus cajan]